MDPDRVGPKPCAGSPTLEPIFLKSFDSPHLRSSQRRAPPPWLSPSGRRSACWWACPPPGCPGRSGPRKYPSRRCTARSSPRRRNPAQLCSWGWRQAGGPWSVAGRWCAAPVGWRRRSGGGCGPGSCRWTGQAGARSPRGSSTCAASAIPGGTAVSRRPRPRRAEPLYSCAGRRPAAGPAGRRSGARQASCGRRTRRCRGRWRSGPLRIGGPRRRRPGSRRQRRRAALAGCTWTAAARRRRTGWGTHRRRYQHTRVHLRTSRM